MEISPITAAISAWYAGGRRFSRLKVRDDILHSFRRSAEMQVFFNGRLAPRCFGQIILKDNLNRY